ncbi:MAG: type VI secretion system ATPase TssH, partial [Candidatus Aminicenantes bacterium]|nr:type VI secretion system ATPase TssH [Candidatus Aminicenantes bacterium]
MKWDKFTLMSQDAFQLARSKAEDLGHQEITPEHLLWAFLEQKENVVQSVLSKIGVRPSEIKSDLETSFGKIPKVQGSEEVYLSSNLQQIMKNAQKEADKFKDEFISTEHLFLALFKDSSSRASKILTDSGVTEDAFLKALMLIRGNQRITDAEPEGKY